MKPLDPLEGLRPRDNWYVYAAAVFGFAMLNVAMIWPHLKTPIFAFAWFTGYAVGALGQIDKRIEDRKRMIGVKDE